VLLNDTSIRYQIYDGTTITILAQKEIFCFGEGLPLRKVKIMSDKNKKQFGVWMDSHNATIVAKEDVADGAFIILGHVKNAGPDNNSNEKTAHNQEIGLTHKFFKEIASKMPNIDEIHITGTGQVQEQFMKFLAETPQYKNAVSSESTSNKMSDENLAIFIGNHFN
jgi:stalled ribosome rescue protein Dom34